MQKGAKAKQDQAQEPSEEPQQPTTTDQAAASSSTTSTSKGIVLHNSAAPGGPTVVRSSSSRKKHVKAEEEDDVKITGESKAPVEPRPTSQSGYSTTVRSPHTDDEDDEEEEEESSGSSEDEGTPDANAPQRSPQHNITYPPNRYLFTYPAYKQVSVTSKTTTQR